MYSKFSPYKVQNSSDKEILDSHTILIKILTRKKTGVDFHNKLYLMFKLLNMKGFSKEQKYRMKLEFKEFIHLQKYYMKKYNKIPHIQYEPIKVDPYNISQMDIYNLTGDKKSMIIKNLFEEWKNWECETKDLLNEYLSMDEEDCEEIEETLKDVEHEIKKLKKQLIEYNDIEWCIKYLYEKQHHLKHKYNEKLEEMG